MTGSFLLSRHTIDKMKDGGSVIMFASMYGIVSPKPNLYPEGINPNPIEYKYEDYLPLSDNGGGKYNFDISRFKISHCWSVFYNKGDCVELHNHFPYALSFAYYVNMPEGSSPIMIDGEVIYPEEGQVVFFPGSSFHSVPPSKVSGRCMIAGNIMYVDKY